MAEYKFRKNVVIGDLDADNDTFLFEAFVQKPEISILSDVSDPRSIIIGRTGSGKTALIRYLENNHAHVVRINPEEMSLNYLSNSDILQYFAQLGINLDMFYKLLWKHVFIVEMLKLHFGQNYTKERNWLQTLRDKYISNPKKKKAIEYLQKFENEFWEKTETQIKAIEKNLKNSFISSLGVNSEFFSHFLKTRTLSEENEKIKAEVKHKAQNIVSAIQLEEIYGIMDILKDDLFKDLQRKYFILIDDLDKDWVDTKIRYDLIKGLILAVSELRKIPNTKIILSLRSNILEIIFSKPSFGIQREKYTNLNVKIEWTKKELREFLNNRLKILMKGTYTKDSPTVDDILPPAHMQKAHKQKEGGFDYIINRTLMRPRDVMAFFNICIKNSDGNTKITREILTSSEREYSLDRLNAIYDEWYENYGNLNLLTKFLRGRSNGFSIAEIKENDLADFLFNDVQENFSPETKHIQEEYYKTSQLTHLLQKILSILYNVGLIGIKKNPQEKMKFIYETSTMLYWYEIEAEAKFYVHPAFLQVLNIKPNQ